MPHSPQTTIPTATENNGRTALVILVLGLLCLSVYGNSLHVPFVYDDILNIAQNPHIRMREISPASLADVFKSSSRHLANFSFAINYHLHRLDVRGYHIVNWIIHWINGVLVFLLTRRTLGLLKNDPAWAPFLTAALWLTNPVHTQSVTYIVQRMNAMAVMFYLMSLLLYIRARTAAIENGHRKARVLLFVSSGVAGIFALASKQIAVSLPAMIFLYEWFFIRDLQPGFIARRVVWLAAIAGAILALAFIYLGDSPLAAVLAKYETKPFTMGQRLLTQPRVVVHYLSLLLLPLPDRLALDAYVPPSTSLVSPPATLFALGLLALAVLLAVRRARSNRLLSFAVFWFLGTLALESSFLGLELRYEHRTYLPSVFVFMAITCGLMHYVHPSRLAVVAIIGLVLVSGIWTRQRNAVWADDVRFWQDNIKKSPKSPRAYNNLGIALALRGRYAEGIAACRRSIAMSPPAMRIGEVYNNIGRMYHDAGDNQKAMEHARWALRIEPDLSEAHLNLGAFLLDEKLADQAVDHLQTAIDRSPWLIPAYPLLALAVHQKTGDTDQAIRICRQGLAMDPDDPESESVLATLLRLAGEPQQSLFHLERVLAKIPSHPQANLNAGMVLNTMKRPEEAIPFLTRAVAALPDHVPARAELGSALMAADRLDEAEEQLARSLDLSPDNPSILAALGQINQQRQRFAEAVFYYKRALALAPDDPRCLNQLAIVLAADGRFDEAVAVLEKLGQLLPASPTVSYNLACLYGRRDQPDKAIGHLQKALEKGYDDWQTLRSDPDLESIRQTPFYINLINFLEQGAHDRP